MNTFCSAFELTTVVFVLLLLLLHVLHVVMTWLEKWNVESNTKAASL